MKLPPTSVALVFVGGMLGTAVREGLSLAFPAAGGVPFAILAINVTGAFALGFLLHALALTGEDTGRRRAFRLFAGTGVLGGYTTYSALASDSALLLGTGSTVAGVLYPLATVLVGAVATFLGLLLASSLFARRRGGEA